MYSAVIISAFLIVCALIVLSAMKRSGHFIKSLFVSALEGIAALFAVNAAGTFTGVMLSVNWLTLSSGVIFGIPGIAANIIAQVIMR